MHHRNHKNSSANHSNPQHYQPKKPQYPTRPNPGGAYQPKKESFLDKIRNKISEKPATKDEVQQLGLNAKREVYKAQIQKAKSARKSNSGMGGLFAGSSSRQPSYRRSSPQREDNSWLMNNNTKSSFLDNDNFGSGLDAMFGGSSPKKGKNQKSGLEEMF